MGKTCNIYGPVLLFLSVCYAEKVNRDLSDSMIRLHIVCDQRQHKGSIAEVPRKGCGNRIYGRQK